MSKATKPRASSNSDRSAILGLVIVGFLAHGILMLTDYQMWDAWWIWRGMTVESEFPKLVAFNAEWARPLDLWLYWMPFAKLFGWNEAGVVACKVFAVVCWVATGPLVYVWMRRGLLTDVGTSFAVAGLAVSLPLFDVMGDITYAMYSCSVMLFWGAWALFGPRLSSHAASAGAAKERLACLGLFFLAFNLNSQLMFFYSVWFAALIFRRPLSVGGLCGEGWRDFKKWPDFALLPIAYFVGKHFLFPQSGHYADYNKPSLDPQRLSEGLISLYGFLTSEVAFALGSPAALGASAVVAAVCFVLCSRNDKWAMSLQMPDNTCDGKLLLSGGAMLAAAWFPYASVGQIFSADGYTTRNTILMGVPLGMIMIGAGRPVISAFSRSRAWVSVVSLAFVLTLLIASNVRGYLGLQAFGAKQEAVARSLEKASIDFLPTVIQVRDYFPLPHSINYYPPSIWTLLLARSKPSATTFVVDTRPFAQDGVVTNADGTQSLQVPVIPIDANGLYQLKQSTTMPSFFNDIPASGKQLLAVISPGQVGTDPQLIGAKYLAARFLSKDRLDQFIDSVASVQVQAVPDVVPVYQ